LLLYGKDLMSIACELLKKGDKAILAKAFTMVFWE